MRRRLLGTALISALALAGCAEGDPADINNSVTTGEPPKPGSQASGGGGTSEMARKSGGYPMPKGARPPGGAPAGEASKPGDEAPAEAGAPASESAPKDGAEPAAPGVALGEEELKNIAKLAPEDQELAKAQVVCLISGEPLGSMGVPVRVEHEGEVGFLCCKGCQADFDKDPAAALAKRKK
jgi:hypothetical protein